MSDWKFTPGPWQWDVSLTSKRAKLMGGTVRYDLLVLDFIRWGMGGAKPRFRTGPDNMNVMRPVEDFAVVAPGREHHADWFRLVNHPDAKLIESAPDLHAAAAMALAFIERLEPDSGTVGELCVRTLRAALDKSRCEMPRGKT